MPAIIPIVIGLGAIGAMAFAAGGKGAAVAQKPITHRPKPKAPSVSEGSQAAIIAAMRSPTAMKALIAATAESGDPTKLWNLGRTILLNSKGNSVMQGVAAQVLANAVVMAVKKGKLGDLVAVALANGDAGILAAAAVKASQTNPELAGKLSTLIAQLKQSGKPPRSPGQPQAPRTTVEKNEVNAAKAATAVVVDAIKKSGQIATSPASAPLPSSNVTTLPEMIITPGPDFVPGGGGLQDDATTAAQRLTEYLQTTSRYHEDKSKVGLAQGKLGLSADGNYGPGTAKKIASLGVVPVPPFYWTKGKAPAQKKDYKSYIAQMAGTFSDRDWSPALKGVDQS